MTLPLLRAGSSPMSASDSAGERRFAQPEAPCDRASRLAGGKGFVDRGPVWRRAALAESQLLHSLLM